MAVDNRHSRHWLFAAGATGFAALLIACGGTGSDSPTTPTQSAAPTTQAAALPDGDHLAVLKSLDLTGHTAVVDPVEMLTGEAAQTACLADHADDPDLCELDFYVANPAEESIEVPVAADAGYRASIGDMVEGAEAPGETGWEDLDGQWNCQDDEGCPLSAEDFTTIGQDVMLVNLLVEGGQITLIGHQYTP